jgi:hypothetical protein
MKGHPLITIKNTVRTCKAIELSPLQKKILEEMIRCRSLPHSLVQRAKIILQSSEGIKNKVISADLKIKEETVGMWRKRWLSAITEFAAYENKPKMLRQLIEQALSDAPRTGAPAIFTPEQICLLIALACETPPPHLSVWSRTSLVQEAIKRNIVESVSPTSIGRFLKSGADKAASITLLAQL